MNKIALKPCPFCGSGNVHLGGSHWVECDDCTTSGPGYIGTSLDGAIEQWNRRTPDYETKLREAEQEIAYLNSRLNGGE